MATKSQIRLIRIFLSTLPSRGATGAYLTAYLGDLISIHAPLAGSDEDIDHLYPDRLISIHAPLAGSDFDAPELEKKEFVFLSTLPSRGATFFILFLRHEKIFLSTLPSRGAT